MRFLSGDTDETAFMGTFSGNPIAGAATKASLEILDEIGIDGYDALADRGDRLVEGFREILTDAGHDVFVPDHAGFFCVHFTDGETDPQQWSGWRDVSRHSGYGTVEAFATELVAEGIFIPPTHGRINLMHAHTDEHVDEALAAAKVAAGRI
jgi:glutamate-1-semialdehyde aminotransferase